MSSITIARFTEELVVNYRGRGCAASTVRQVAQVMREFAAVGVKRTSDLTDGAIARWKTAWPSRTPSTLKSHLRCLSAICTRAKKKGYLKLDPFEVDPVSSWARDDSRPAAAKRQWSKSGDEVRRVLARADLEAAGGSWEAARDRAYAYTVFLTGARSGEIQRLEVSDIDWDRKTLKIRPKWIPMSGGRQVWWKPKTDGSSAEIPIGDRLLAVLKEWSKRCVWNDECAAFPTVIAAKRRIWLFPGKKLRGPWTSGGRGVRPLDRLKALGVRAGVKGVTNKAGRKGIGTHAKTMGLTTFERREYFRHGDDATGDFYDDEKIESMRPAAVKIERFYLAGAI